MFGGEVVILVRFSFLCFFCCCCVVMILGLVKLLGLLVRVGF